MSQVLQLSFVVEDLNDCQETITKEIVGKMWKEYTRQKEQNRYGRQMIG